MKISQYTTDSMKEEEVCILIKANDKIHARCCQLNKAKDLTTKQKWIRQLAELAVIYLKKPK